MEISSKLLAFGGALLVLCAAVPLYFARVKPPNPLLKIPILTRASFVEIIKEIRVLYSQSYYKNLFNARAARRKHSSESKEYKRIVNKFNKDTQTMLEEATLAVLRRFRTTKQVFEDSVNYYDSDLELKEHSEALVCPIYESVKGPVLSKENTKSVLDYFSQRLQDLGAHELDLDEYMIVSSQIEDEIYSRIGVEIEEVNACYEKFEEEYRDIVEPMRVQTSYVLASAEYSF